MSYTTIVLGISGDGSVSYAEYPGKTPSEIGAIPVQWENHHTFKSPQDVLGRIGLKIEECKRL